MLPVIPKNSASKKKQKPCDGRMNDERCHGTSRLKFGTISGHFYQKDVFSTCMGEQDGTSESGSDALLEGGGNGGTHQKLSELPPNAWGAWLNDVNDAQARIP